MDYLRELASLLGHRLGQHYAGVNGIVFGPHTADHHGDFNEALFQSLLVELRPRALAAVGLPPGATLPPGTGPQHLMDKHMDNISRKYRERTQ